MIVSQSWTDDRRETAYAAFSSPSRKRIGMGMKMTEIEGKLSIVMPAYNEGVHIYENIIKTRDIIAAFAADTEIIVVNDGSIDNTKSEIERACARCDNVRMVSSTRNHGKGSAILAGVAESCGEFIAFLDADLELDPAQLEGYLIRMKESECDVVIASKLHKDSQLSYPLKRRIMSIGYYIMLRVLFRLKLKDTQTGLKLFRAKAIKPVAHLIRTSGFAYDIEILVAIRCRGGKIEEMPVRVVYKRERTARRIRFADVWHAFKDTLSVFIRARFRKYYD